jgi:hypothetical protein
MTDQPLLDGVAPSLPEDLRGFLDCTVDTATIRNGPIEWLEIPSNVRAMLGGKSPELQVAPGSGPGTAVLTIRAGWIGATLPAAVVSGRLSIDTSKLPFLTPASIKRDILRFVDELNARLAANGMALGEPVIGPDGMTLSKVPLGA